MSSDIAINREVQSGNNWTLDKPTSNEYSLSSTITTIADKRSVMRSFDQNPEIYIPPSSLRSKSTSTSYDELDLTRNLESQPVIRLPQNVVAQKYALNVVDSNALPIQIWEGCVQSVNLEEHTMRATLNAKMGKILEHIGNIDLQWVPDQDADLIKPGAVFYLTLFKRIKSGGSIENSQVLSFRRRPNWSKSQLENIEKRAKTFLSKLKNGQIAD